VAKYNALKDPSNEFDISQAETNFVIAQARLGAAESCLPTAIGRRESIEDRLAAAQADIQAAQAALDNLDLVASINGTIVDLDLIKGEQFAAGANVAQIADFSQWYVETDNLTEIDVVEIAVGQPVSVVFDALSAVELSGVVDSISDVFEEKRGDITYTTRIVLDDNHPHLRWGMTGAVTFEE
jgi:HlyD family secretion protein